MKYIRVYLAAAVTACHINMRTNGFRQKDVHFFFDLFSNWMESYLGKRSSLQNTQISRYLDQLVKKQILKKSGGRQPIYHCTDTHILPLIEEMGRVENEDHLELLFFQHHLLEIYYDLIFNTVLESNWHLPHSAKIEIKYLLNREVLIEKQKLRVRKELEKLELRSNETLEMDKMASKLFKEGKDEKAVIRQVEKILPYQLNNQLEMSELYGKLLPNLRRAELTTNAKRRVETLWSPLIKYYQDYLKRLEELKSQS